MIGKFALPIVAAGLTTAFGLFAAPVMADPAKSPPRVTIDYRGVDLTSVEGRQTLDRRVDNAIDEICGRPVFGTHDENEILSECRREIRSRIEPVVATVLLKASANSASTR